MEKVVEIGTWVLVHWMEVLGGLGALGMAYVGLMRIIPGDQGEGLVERISKQLMGIGKK